MRPRYRRVGHETQIVEHRGHGTALVKDQHGRKALLVSTAALQARNERGTLAPVDLSLERTAAKIAPRNSRVPFTVDRVGQARMRFAGLGVGMRLDGAKEPVGGQRLAARSSTAQVADDRVFFANVHRDTDAGVLPLPNGSELFLIARSERAPQQFSLGLDLPAGATLRMAVSDTPVPAGLPRSVEIVKSGQPPAYVTAPVAHDAHGRGVPASMSIQGQDIVVDVPHCGLDVRHDRPDLIVWRCGSVQAGVRHSAL